MAVGGQQASRGKAAHDGVPGRQDAVERAGEIARAGGEREAGRRVDGVVHLARPVRVAGEGDHHEIVAAGPQRVVGEPTARGEVREQRPGRGHQLRDELSPLVLVQIDLDRALALVEARPEQALPARRQRPAVAVEAAADLVEADHVRAELRERHAAERRRNEGGALDHGQVAEDPGGHAAYSTAGRQSSTSPPSFDRTILQVDHGPLDAHDLDPRREPVLLEHGTEVIA